jgi:hypothetical protein
MRGDSPDGESLERHDRKRRSEDYNDEDGKLGVMDASVALGEVATMDAD